jgi:polyhydroxyalkanoate synthesis repressor PhaR
MAVPEPPAEPGPEPVPITRYPNRRLYDRSRARYVTLHDVAELVRAGHTVTVRDSRTGEDLTRSVLTQILLEYYPERMELLPVSVLGAMIRANETVMLFLRDYLQQSLTYLDLLQRPGVANPLLVPMHWMRTFLPPAAAPAPAPSAAGPEAAALARRVTELEQRLEQMQAGRRGKRRENRGGGPS